MNCNDARVLLASRRDLSRSQRADLESHLATCRACAAARGREDRLSATLQLLPAATAAIPTGVEQRILGRLARRARRAERGRGLAMACSLGAGALALLLLLNILGGGALLGRPGDAQTGAGAARVPPGELLYLVQTRRGDELLLSAFAPGQQQTQFSRSLGGGALIQGEGYQELRRLRADVALSPDGHRLFAVTRSGGAELLVAHDARSGAELWRSPLDQSALPFALGSRLIVTPDGGRVVLRVFPERWPAPPDAEPLSIQVFDAATGAPLPAPPALELPVASTLVLPLDDGSLLVGSTGDLRRIYLDEPGLASRYESPTAAAADVEAAIAHRAANRILFAAAAAALAPDGRTAYVLGQDLSLIEVALRDRSIEVLREVDLDPNGRFFFGQSAFSADGATAAVATEVRDAQTGRITAELRVYDLRAGRELRRFTIERPIQSLALSADASRLYLIYPDDEVFRPYLGAGPAATPAATAPQLTTSSLAAIELAGGELRVLRSFEGRAELLLAGR